MITYLNKRQRKKTMDNPMEGMRQEVRIEIPLCEKTLIENASLNVLRQPSGISALQATLPNGRQYIIPMSPDVAREIGMQLAAPGIVAPPVNGMPPQS